MGKRQLKGLQIANQKQVRKTNDGWFVKSQSASGFYKVDELFNCNCPDAQFHKATCKHAFAVRFYLKTEIDTPNGKIVAEKRVTYSQNWKAYDKSQQEEKTRFLELLSDLCLTVQEPTYAFGRPKASQRDLLFASALKVYSQFSLRRFMSDLQTAKEKKLVSSMPCFASVGHFMQKPELTLILQELITLSALPLKSVETNFAVDSSGFRTTKFNDYCTQAHGLARAHKFLKAHVLCGVKTNIICSATITEENGADSPQFAPLVETTASNGFQMLEVTADKAYSSRDNYEAVKEVGGIAFIPFKSNATGKTRGSLLWRKMFHYFQFNQDEFLQHYHKRSNVETTFSMIKAKFNDLLKSKTTTAQINECLLKILCHNIVVIIHETNELGINPNFGVESKQTV